MSQKKAYFLLFLLFLFLTACSAETMSEAVSEPGPSDTSTNSGEAFFGDDQDMEEVAMPREAADVAMMNDVPQERLIIRTADLSIVVTDTEAAIETITDMIEGSNGWVVNSNLYQYRDNAKSGTITVRVPVENYNSALEAIKGLAVEVNSESASGQDVTEEYVDLSSRLTNLELTADRVRELMDEARNVEETLAVNAELSRLEEQIEVIKGRMQFLDQSARFSTITVNLMPDIAAQPINPQGWRPGGVARNAVESLVNALQGAGTLLIWFAIFIVPLGLLVGVPLWAVIRFVRRRRQQPSSMGTPAPLE